MSAEVDVSRQGEVKVPVGALAFHIGRDYVRMQQYFFLPVYIAFIVLITLILLISRVNYASSYADLFFDNAALNALGGSAFLNVSSPDDLLHWFLGLETTISPWMSSTASTQAGLANTDAFDILDVVNIRQLRTGPAPCADTAQQLPPLYSQQLTMGPLCARKFSYSDPVGPFVGYGPLPLYEVVLNASQRATTTTTTAAPAANTSLDKVNVTRPVWFFPSMSQAATRRLVPIPRVAKFFDVSYPDIEYSQMQQLNVANLTASLEKLLITDRFMDRFTRMLCVDFIAHFVIDDVYVAATLMYEKTNTGAIYVEAFTTYFRTFENQGYLGILDGLLALFTAALLALAVIDLKESLSIQSAALPVKAEREASWLAQARLRARCFFNVITFWELNTFALLFMACYVFVMRLSLWYSSPSPTMSEAEKFNWAATFGVRYSSVYEVCCYCYILVAVRFVYSCQYLSGLHLIANTVRYAADNFFRIGSITLLVMLVFSLAANIIFGQDLYACRTFPWSGAWLTRVLISAEVNDSDYSTITTKVGKLADVFLNFYFLLCWLMILNLFTATMSMAFMLGKKDDENVDTIRSVVTTYFTLTADTFSIDSHTEVGTRSRVSPSQRVASAGLRLRSSFKQRFATLFAWRRQRVACYLALTKLPRDRHVQLAELVEMLRNEVPPSEAWLEEAFIVVARSLLKQRQTASLAKKSHEKMLDELRKLRNSVVVLQFRAVSEFAASRKSVSLKKASSSGAFPAPTGNSSTFAAAASSSDTSSDSDAENVAEYDGGAIRARSQSLSSSKSFELEQARMRDRLSSKPPLPSAEVIDKHRATSNPLGRAAFVRFDVAATTAVPLSAPGPLSPGSRSDARPDERTPAASHHASASSPALHVAPFASQSTPSLSAARKRGSSFVMPGTVAVALHSPDSHPGDDHHADRLAAATSTPSLPLPHSRSLPSRHRNDAAAAAPEEGTEMTAIVMPPLADAAESTAARQTAAAFPDPTSGPETASVVVVSPAEEELPSGTYLADSTGTVLTDEHMFDML